METTLIRHTASMKLKQLCIYIYMYICILVPQPVEACLKFVWPCPALVYCNGDTIMSRCLLEYSCLEGGGDFASRLVMGTARVTTWFIGFVNLLARSP